MKFGRNSSILIFLFLCLSANAAGDVKVLTHCKSNEKVIFSCPFKNGKTVSLCASPSLSKNTGTLQYRFGRTGQKLELIYPKSNIHPRENFWYEEADAIFPARAAYIGFSVGSVEYSLNTFEAPNTDEYVAHLEVSEKKKILARLTCALSDAQNLIGLTSDIGLSDFNTYKQK